MFLVLLVVSLGLAPLAAPAQAPVLRIAAASDLQAALPELIGRFQQHTGLQVSATFGSSGNFFTQIQNGAPFDVFLSADIDYPRRLVDGGFAQPGTLVRYAQGRLVVWTRRDSGIDVKSGLRVLLDSRVRRIAIANPEHAPYGRAAVAALRREGLYDRVRPRLVVGESILQAAQFAHSGNADVGIIALALAAGPSLRALGAYAEVPASLHPAIEQGGVVLKAARDQQAARQFISFLQRADSVKYLASHGFQP